MVTWLLVVSALSAAPGCTKDTDCKGDRICESGKCVDPPVRAVASPPEATDAGVAVSEPPPPPPPPPPAPNPADYPKVTRSAGVVCVETLSDQGEVMKDCRADGAAYTGTSHGASEPQQVGVNPTRRGETKDDRSPVVADFAALGTLGVLVAGPGVGIAPGFGLHASVGGRLNEIAAMGAMLDAQFLFGGGTLIGLTLAPAVRLGDAGHVTLGLGPTLLIAAVTGLGSGVGIAGSFIVHGAVPVAGGFGIHPRLGVSFGPGGVIFTFAFGFGGSVY